MHFKLTHIIAATALATALGAGCGDDFEVTDQPLQGQVGSQPWTFVSGHTNAFLSDATRFSAALYSTQVDSCGFSTGGQDGHLLVSIPTELGLHDFGPALNMTFVEYEQDGSSNLIATDGVIDVIEIGTDTITAGIHGKFNGDNEVDGIFEVTICAGE